MYNEICGEILDAVFDPFQWNQGIYLYLPVSQMGNIDGNNFTQQNNGYAYRTANLMKQKKDVWYIRCKHSLRLSTHNTRHNEHPSFTSILLLWDVTRRGSHISQ